MKAVLVLVSGRVQGVGFWWSASSVAGREGVAGYARNLDDGRVELWLEGGAGPVDRMLEWARSGPEGASVEDVEVVEREPSGRSGFSTG